MRKLARPNLFFLFFVTLTIGIVVLLAAAFWDYTQDDVFITYVYSRNIAEGKGFVFNPGERVQGTTTPLYTLFMAGVYLLTSDLLHAGNLLSVFFLLITCGLAISLMRRYLSIYGRAAIAITLAASPLVYVSFGMETLFYSAVLMFGFWLWEKNRRREAMWVAAALTWIRADGVILGASLWLLVLWEVWQTSSPHRWQNIPWKVGAQMGVNESTSNQRMATRNSLLTRLDSGSKEGNESSPTRFVDCLRPAPRGSLLHSLTPERSPWKLGLIYLAGIAPWFLFAWTYFGTPLPNTFGAKQEIFGGLSFLADGVGWWRSLYGNNPLALFAVPLIGLGAWRAVVHPRLRPLASWAALYSAGYTALNVTTFWYYTPLVVVFIVLAALGGEWVAQRLILSGFHRHRVAGGALALVLLSSVLAIMSARDYAVPPPRVTTYRLLGEWIEKNTHPDETILVGDLGIMGYHARRRTIDSPGLIVADMHYKQDGYAVAKYKPDYVVATQYWTWGKLIGQDWFRYHYTPLAQFSTSGDDFSPMTVYRRRLPIEPPQQIIQGFDLPLSCPVRLNTNDRLPAETRARLISPEGEVLVETSHPFLWNQYPASQVPALEVLIDQIALPLTVRPGVYIWEMECDQIVSGDIEVLPIDQAPGYASSPSAQWKNFARLRGVAFPEGFEVWSGGSLDVMLHWEALGAAQQDYSVFVHLLDANGHLAAQNDGYPRDGLRPTTNWQTGEMIVDIRRILLPADLPEGKYTLVVGWYDWRTGDRLSVIDGADSLRLPFAIHNRVP